MRCRARRITVAPCLFVEQLEPLEWMMRREGEEPGALYTMAVVSGLGFEFVSLVVGGALVGMWIDKRFETAPVALLVGIGLGMMSAAWHVWLLTRRLLKSDRGEDDGTSDDE
jgi:F0F1-type ATP synthase assembly protein I